MRNKPYILCAAIYFNDGNHHYHQPKNVDHGFVIVGRMHHNIWTTIKLLGADRLELGKSVQGFITSDNRFVGRNEAAKIAFKAKQTATEKRELYSEDIY